MNLTDDQIKILSAAFYRLQLSDIPRWIKVPMRRPQNVAEHTLNVLILALSLYNFMQGNVPHNSTDLISLLNWAIEHDMDEIVTGDLPADLKAELEKVAPGRFDEAVSNIMSRPNRLPTYGTHKAAMHGSYPYDLVKIADKLEEVLYNKRHGYEERATYALNDGLRLLRERLLGAEKRHPRYDWQGARAWLAYFLHPIFYGTPGTYGPSEKDILGPAPPAPTV